jgi:hypothetical protein
MKMPMGKFIGQPVEKMTTGYLAWLVCNDAIRFKRWPLVVEALRVLRTRFAHFEDLLAELQVKEAPPEHWKTAKRKAERQAEKRAKLIDLEARREVKRKAQRDQLRAMCVERLRGPTPPPALDAHAFVRQMRIEEARGRSPFISDLV